MKTRSIEIVLRNISLGLFYFFIGYEAFSQEATTKFYDHDGVSVDSIYSYYYERITYSPQFALVSFYTKTGKVREKQITQDSTDNQYGVRFYENGNKMWEANIYKFSFLGTVRSYYMNGIEKSELFFDSSKTTKHRMRVINYRDSLGNVQIENKNGLCNRCELQVYSASPYFETGTIVNGLKSGDWAGVNQTNDVTYSETYSEGVLLKGMQNYKGEIYTYTELEKQAMPPNGMQEIYRLIGNKMKYPRAARRHGIEGKVFVQFVVDKDGSIIDTKVTKGIDPECDNEALNAVKSLPNWIPGYQRGRPVKQRFTLPVQFKLGE